MTSARRKMLHVSHFFAIVWIFALVTLTAGWKITSSRRSIVPQCKKLFLFSKRGILASHNTNSGRLRFPSPMLHMDRESTRLITHRRAAAPMPAVETATPHHSHHGLDPLRRIDYVEDMPCAYNNDLENVPNQSCHHMKWTASVKTYHPIFVADENFPITEYILSQSNRYQNIIFRDLNITKDYSTDEWRCKIGSVNFFGLEFQPILYTTAHISHDNQQVEFNITRSEISIGSNFAEFNRTFVITGSNVISSGVDKLGFPTIESALNVQVQCLFPMIKLPKNLLQHCGVHIVQCALNAFAPHIINTLAVDYIRWMEEQKKTSSSKTTHNSQ